MTEPKPIVPGCGGAPPVGSAEAQDEDKARKEILSWKAQAALTDAEILASYCEKLRANARSEIAWLEQYLAGQQADRDYVATYGTDEG